jgi:hypothetical protein
MPWLVLVSLPSQKVAGDIVPVLTRVVTWAHVLDGDHTPVRHRHYISRCSPVRLHGATPADVVSV